MTDKFKKEYMKKYINHIYSLNDMAIIIQLRWLIDEKDINLRNEVWFNPPIAPMRADIKINVIIKYFKNIIYDKIIRGANFCHVIKIKLLYQFKLSITFGNQKWKGAAPNFNINVIHIINKE